MLFLLLSGNSHYRANLDAGQTSGAGISNLIGDETSANTGRAFFIPDMGFIFLAKILQSTHEGVGAGLPQSAKRANLDIPRKLLHQFEVAVLSLAFGNPLA